MAAWLRSSVCAVAWLRPLSAAELGHLAGLDLSHADELGPSLRPAVGLGPMCSPAEPGESWIVLYTARAAAAARACDYVGARHYLPLHEHSTGRDPRGRRYLTPLFPSYLFACLTHWTQLDVLATSPIVRVIPVWHPHLLLAELSQIRRALEGGADITVGPCWPR
jgi:hypothetical protein